MSDSTYANALSWKIKPFPTKSRSLELDGTISPAHFALIQKGYIPQSANDKWFIYYENEYLNFHRAVSGSCIFRLQIRPNEDHFLAPALEVNADPTQYKSINDQYDVELTSYLIDRYLLGRNPQFPMPGKMNRHHQQNHVDHVLGGSRQATPSPATISLKSLLEQL